MPIFEFIFQTFLGEVIVVIAGFILIKAILEKEILGILVAGAYWSGTRAQNWLTGPSASGKQKKYLMIRQTFFPWGGQC